MGWKVLGSTIVAVIPGKGLPIDPGLIGMPGKLVMTIDPVSVCQ